MFERDVDMRDIVRGYAIRDKSLSVYDESERMRERRQR